MAIDMEALHLPQDDVHGSAGIAIGALLSLDNAAGQNPTSSPLLPLQVTAYRHYSRTAVGRD